MNGNQHYLAYDNLPGGEILRKGLEDLQDGVRSIDALLVLVGAPRLTRCGIRIPQACFATALPEHDLYRLLCTEHGPEAYRHYRSLIRRLVSLENALDGLLARERDGSQAEPRAVDSFEDVRWPE